MVLKAQAAKQTKLSVVLHFHDGAAADALHPGGRHGEVEGREAGGPGGPALQHQHPGALVLHQPPCSDTGGRAAAGEDVIVAPAHGRIAQGLALPRCIPPVPGVMPSMPDLLRSCAPAWRGASMPGMESDANRMDEASRLAYLMAAFSTGSFSVPDFLQTFSKARSATRT